jgi:hypothetical protein
LEEVEVSAAVHLALDELQFADLAFGLPVGPRQGDIRLNRGHLPADRRSEAKPFRPSQRVRARAPFDGFPQSGLLELVRDLIDYAYRDWPSNAEMAAIGQFDPQPGEELPDTAEC